MSQNTAKKNPKGSCKIPIETKDFDALIKSLTDNGKSVQKLAEQIQKKKDEIEMKYGCGFMKENDFMVQSLKDLDGAMENLKQAGIKLAKVGAVAADIGYSKKKE